ncbi:MAG: hypothetical protein M1378_05790, partial [Bacteroidetes bacterium]|nr:hypothetical protein [Bacteroidota bacterium]
MGEFAIRKSGGERVKIGTCESMYYARYEDRVKLSSVSDSIDPRTTDSLFWRLPFPDEDNVPIGEYANPTRGLRLWRPVKHGNVEYTEDFNDPETASVPGFIQLTHESGLLLNVTCYHGVKLPEASRGVC